MSNPSPNDITANRRAQFQLLDPGFAWLDLLKFRPVDTSTLAMRKAQIAARLNGEPGDTIVHEQADSGREPFGLWYHSMGYRNIRKILPSSPDGRRQDPKGRKRQHQSGKYPGIQPEKIYLSPSEMNPKHKVAVVFLYRDSNTGLLRIYMVEQRTSNCLSTVKGGVEDIRRSIQAAFEVREEIGLMLSPEYFENVCLTEQVGHVTVFAAPLGAHVVTNVIDTKEISRVLEVPLVSDPDGEADLFMYINQGRVTETSVKVISRALAMLSPFLNKRNVYDARAVEYVLRNGETWAAVAKAQRQRIREAMRQHAQASPVLFHARSGPAKKANPRQPTSDGRWFDVKDKGQKRTK